MMRGLQCWLTINPVRVKPDDILTGPVGPTIYRMTVPMVIGIFCMMAFSAVDTFFVSMMGAEALAAISFTLPVTMVLVNLVIGLSIGTSVMVGSAIGKNGMDKASRITTDSLLFSVLIVIAVSVLGYFTIDPLFMSLGASELTLPLIHEYMDVYYIFIGFLVIPMIGNSAIRATGDTKWPSIIMMISGLINVVLDPVLIFGLGPVPAMGVAGAAWATVASWVIGFFFVFYLLYVRERLIVLTLPPTKELLSAWKTVLKIAIPISIANMMMPFAMGAITRFVSEYGEIAVAGLGAGSRIESFALVIPFAITAALSPFMAQNLGAGNLQRAHDSLVISIKFIMKFQFLIFVIFCGGAHWLSQLFASEPDVIEVTKYYLWVMPLGIGFYSISIVLNTAFNAEHRSDRTLLVSAIRILIFYIPLAWLGGEFFGLIGIFAGATIGNGIASWTGWMIYKKTQPKAAENDEARSDEEPITPVV